MECLYMTLPNFPQVMCSESCFIEESNYVYIIIIQKKALYMHLKISPLLYNDMQNVPRETEKLPFLFHVPILKKPAPLTIC